MDLPLASQSLNSSTVGDIEETPKRTKRRAEPVTSQNHKRAKTAVSKQSTPSFRGGRTSKAKDKEKDVSVCAYIYTYVLYTCIYIVIVVSLVIVVSFHPPAHWTIRAPSQDVGPPCR